MKRISVESDKAKYLRDEDWKIWRNGLKVAVILNKKVSQ